MLFARIAFVADDKLGVLGDEIDTTHQLNQLGVGRTSKTRIDFDDDRATLRPPEFNVRWPPARAESLQAAQAEAEHWSYEGEAGPEHWGSLSNDNSACSAGWQQSPLAIRGAIKADIPGLALNWKSGGAILNHGHTIQVKAAPGGSGAAAAL